MTMPERRTRALRPGRRFDLRSTAMFFGLLAAALVIGGLAVRALAGVVERRPVWAVVLLCLAVAVAVARGRRRRRLSAAGMARQAGRAFARGTSTALDALDAPAPAPVSAPAPPVIPAQAGPVDEVTSPLPVAQGIDHEALTPDEFEAATAELCARDGCTEVQVVGGAGDLGADVTALTPDGRRLVVQCKRYGEDNKVGSQDLQRFGGTCFTVHEADVAVVVTTGEFTVPALEYAEQCGIVCVDGEGLLAWSQGRAEAPWAAVREETA
ncbi:restriction endonuclease [Streptomyces althioticus]|uniref:restriction endonuclease n=1 Tax=Streptomyces TaxID=1883 RepID=UPI000527D497|nr:restriction endonuclease [Streptomyces sp. MNU103]GGQ42320.1 restriction endonuclease [Streptomyces althioticus]GGT34230.1 restriction endonuclease [Streptomyces matensis]